ncbi:MAG: hypothetical protein N2C14_27840 [Planctomycetales bacterium]
MRIDHPDACGAAVLADDSRRDQLEPQGRLLADQTDEQAADSMASHPGEVRTYRELYFDMADKLDATWNPRTD